MSSWYAISTTPHAVWRENTTIRSASSADANLALTSRTAQQWRGFGGCFNELGWRALSRVNSEERERIFDDLFSRSGCNFTMCRLPVGASDYAEQWYSLNDHEGDFAMRHFSIERDRTRLIPYIRGALQRRSDMQLFASPWSPPAWMKFPRAHNYGTLIWEPRYLEAYALYFLRFVQAYAAEGIPIAQIHVQNEPISTQKFPSCIWTGEQFRLFIRDYLGPLFQNNGIQTEIWLGTLNGPETDERYLHSRYNDYANIVLDDDEARKYIAGVGYQWAGKYALQRTHTAWPDMPLMQTENECGDGANTWEYASYVFDLIYHYLTNNVVAYAYWNMALEEGGESTWGWRQNSLISIDPATGRIRYNPEYYVLKHFSHFVQTGARRLSLEKRWAGNAVAFQNRDSVALVLHNPFDTSRSVITEGLVRCEATLPAQSYTTILVSD